MSHAYRSAYEHIVGMRVAEARVARELVDPLTPRLRALRDSRIARALAGGVGVAGAAATVAAACIDDGGAATYALVAASLASVAAYVVARAVLAMTARDRRAPRPAPLTGRLDADLAQLDASDPMRWLRSFALRLARVEIWSTALPLVAASLLAPLTLHWIFALVFWSESAHSFAGWIRVSLVVVGHAHLALAALAVAFARKMRRMPIEGIAEMRVHREWGKALGITVAIACVPGLLLLALPPILTAVTGLVFVPLVFIVVHRRVLAERGALALVDDAELHARVAAEGVTVL